MPKNNCLFQAKWLEDTKFSGWIRKKTETMAYCKFCSKDISIANMGESALTSHMGGKKHKERTPSNDITSMLSPAKDKNSNTQGPSTEYKSSKTQQASTESSKQQVEVNTMLTNSSTIQAEIRWVLNVVCSKYSMNSCSDSGKLFATMFPDSDIAKAFQCGRTKAGYMSHFGLAPYFHSLLLSKITTVPYYTVSFDESLNVVVQKGQMDLLIRFWDTDINRVSTRYLGSEFMGRSTADDILKTFDQGVSDLHKPKLLQVSSDGPNVNLKFLKSLAKQREEEELDPLIDIGTCGLHVIHGSMKTGAKASGWELQKLLKAMWQFVHDAPSRRTLYENISESLDYPSKFCGHRWCENEDCAEKALTIIKGYQKFVTHVCSLKKSAQPNSKNKSFQTLKSMVRDPLISAKLKFFAMVSGKLNVFLRGFQTDKPMIPFMADVLGDIVRDFIERIILKDTLKKASNLYQMIQLDLNDKNIRKPSTNIDIGFAAQLKLDETKLKSTDSKVIAFKNEAGQFLASLVSHLLEKSPLKCAIVRSAVSINPIHMANKTKRSNMISFFSILLHKLVQTRRISPQSAEHAKEQYQKFFHVVDNNAIAFQGFDQKDDRLDCFFADFMGTSKSFTNLWDVFKMIFTLSHGQSAIERGFSVNKQLLVENLKERSLIALRRIEDHMTSCGESPHEMQITRDMLQHVKQANRRYKEELLNQRKEKENDQKSLKRKIVDDEIKTIKTKRRILQSEIETLLSEADILALKAEKHSNFEYLKESNQKKKLSKAKRTEIEELDKMEEDLSKK